MKHYNTRRFWNPRCFLLVLGMCAAVAPLRAQALPDGEGKDLVAVACTQCHGVKAFTQLRDGVGGWRNTVEEMVLRGAQLSPIEAETAVRYLVDHFGPASGPFRLGTLPAKTALANSTSKSPAESKDITLPDGVGRDAVQQRCSMCHDLGRVVTARRTAAEWNRIVGNMIARGPQATPEQEKAIAGYLTAQFGK